MIYDGEDAAEAQLAGPGRHPPLGPRGRRSHRLRRDHCETRRRCCQAEANALKFRAPDGTLAEIVTRGAYKARKTA